MSFSLSFSFPLPLVLPLALALICVTVTIIVSERVIRYSYLGVVLEKSQVVSMGVEVGGIVSGIKVIASASNNVDLLADISSLLLRE